MTRAIKFKALVDGKWITSKGFIQHKDGTITIVVKENDENVVTSPIEKGTLCEFTGFMDCDGNEIYDGDILSDQVMTDEGLKMSEQQVFWHDDQGCWMLDFSYNQNKSTYSLLSNELEAFKYKIIGNTHIKTKSNETKD